MTAGAGHRHEVFVCWFGGFVVLEKNLAVSQLRFARPFAESVTSLATSAATTGKGKFVGLPRNAEPQAVE